MQTATRLRNAAHLSFLGAGCSYAPGGGHDGLNRGSSVTTLKPVKSCDAARSILHVC